MLALISCLIGYILGSIPFGLLLPMICGYGDIRKIGSGNIGTTNVLRTGNKFLALGVFILDTGKGAASFLIVNQFYGYELGLMAGFCAILGHLFPAWLYFRGGKGVATTLGTLVAASPVVGGSMCGIWVITAAVTRYSSLSALVAMFAGPFLAYYIAENDLLAAFCAFVAALVYAKHRDNIKRLLNGTESRIGQRSGNKENTKDGE